MSCHFTFGYTWLCFFSFAFLVQCDIVQKRPCFSSELEQCWVGESCTIQKQDHVGQGGQPDGLCECMRSHYRNSNGYCLPIKQHPGLPTPAKVNYDSKSSSASVAVGVLVLLLGIGVAVFAVMARRYGWWQRLRQPRVRQYDTALVGGDFDDDPPIA